jgi:hypothetical protein
MGWGSFNLQNELRNNARKKHLVFELSNNVGWAQRNPDTPLLARRVFIELGNKWRQNEIFV